MPKITVNGVSLAYEILGISGPLVVLIPGCGLVLFEEQPGNGGCLLQDHLQRWE